MKGIFLLSALLALFSGFFTRVSEMNTLKLKAENAYKMEDFQRSSRLYLELMEEYKAENEKIIQNLAHSLYQSGQLTEAEPWYKKLSLSEDNKIRSLAFNQLGIIAYESGNQKEAFSNFRLAIIESPSNIFAVYNYELLKKAHQDAGNSFKKQTSTSPSEGTGGEKIKTPKQSEKGETKEGRGSKREQAAGGNKPGEQVNSSDKPGNQSGLQQSDQEQEKNKDLKNQEQGNKSDEDFVSNKLKNYGISPEKALQLLEAMNNEEIMYLQQLKRKPGNSNKNIPDY